MGMSREVWAWVMAEPEWATLDILAAEGSSSPFREPRGSDTPDEGKRLIYNKYIFLSLTFYEQNSYLHLQYINGACNYTKQRAMIQFDI